MRYWLIADGDDGDQWDEFYRDGVVRITGRQRLGDLRQYGSVDMVVQALKDEYKEEFKTKNPAIKARLCFDFGHEVKVGDGIFARHRRETLLGYGVVEPSRKRFTNSEHPAAYFFDRSHPKYPHAIKVRWLKEGTFPVKDYLLPMNFVAEVRDARLASLQRAVGIGNERTAAENAFRDKKFSLGEMKSALLAIREKISDPQMSMLRAHYYHRKLSMEKIAHFGGYGEYRAGNLQYGGFCSRLARRLKFKPPEGIATYIVASPEQDERGHYLWRIDDVVANALEELKWVSQVHDQAPEVSGGSTEFGEVTETERKALISARVGQGTFRTDVIALWGSCAVSKCSLESVLIASHILPWSVANNKERLDPFNGLLLTPNLDKLLDRLLISFNDDGSIRISKALGPDLREALGISEKTRLRFVRPAMRPYLERHRRLFFERQKGHAAS